MYKCVFYDEENNRKTINLNTKNKHEIFYYADKNKLKVISIRKNIFCYKTKKLKSKNLKMLCKQMSILLKSGSEIYKILMILIKESNNNLKIVLEEILSNIERGNSIKEAFEKTKVFPKFYISMLLAGEISGNLDDVMESLAKYYDKEEKLKNNIINILIYPAILIVAMIISFLVILIFLIPNFEEVYINSGIEMPILTRVLISLSHVIKEKFIIFMMIIVVIIGEIFYLKRTNEKLNIMLNKLIFKIPLLKMYGKLIISSKFINSLSILIASGIHVVDAIDISGKTIENEYIYQKIKLANDNIKKGYQIGNSLKNIDELPSLLISMISLGEESGNLDMVLNTMSEYYENKLENKLKRSIKYLENFIILFVGLVVGIVAISMMLPMFDAVSYIQ